MKVGIGFMAISGVSMVIAALIPGGSRWAAELVMTAPGPETTAARLATGIGGALMSGWAITLHSLLRDCTKAEPAQNLSQSLGSAILRGVVAWFVLDCLLSVVLNAPLNLSFNLAYLAALGLPAWRLRGTSRAADSVDARNARRVS